MVYWGPLYIHYHIQEGKFFVTFFICKFDGWVYGIYFGCEGFQLFIVSCPDQEYVIYETFPHVYMWLAVREEGSPRIGWHMLGPFLFP